VYFGGAWVFWGLYDTTGATYRSHAKKQN